ncbi:hypothetical protein TR631_37950 [Streptomyces rochei]|uniref:hypothetical protein n=1 Tax=Streptomyces rochei TaxID=1928 RepID=UPI002ACD45AF|nr:hypothetical protein [Streptomyces rochei]WQC10372.1 hypothetical protein TR631_00360 [Streptomyces rochei]WQC17303.1 hypothetical protein TR631_37950 [Streptomyces rochei]
MSAEVAELMEQVSPYLTAALGAYGGAVLTRSEDATADASANLGRHILHTVWCRRSEVDQSALETAVHDAAEDTEDADAAAALRQQVKRALRDDAGLRRELIGLLPEPSGTVTISASGNRAIAAHSIGTAITGDNARTDK